MKKFLSMLIIILILGSNIRVNADVNENYTNENVEKYTLEDYYKYNNHSSGLQLFSLAENVTEEKIYNALKNIRSSVDVSDELKGVSTDNKEEINRVRNRYFDVLYKSPEIFYVSNSISIRYSYDPRTNKISSAELSITYLYDNNTISDMKKKLDEKVNYIVKNYLEGITNDLEKEYIISDYIVNNTTYDYENYLKGSVPDISHTAYGSLIDGVAVCDGYSKAATLLMNKVGIESGIIISDEMSHAWNYVNIDNKYYHLDLTWNDAVPETNRTNYKYFNLSDDEISIDHYGWDDMAYPYINGNDFSELRNLVNSEYNNIARINNKLYYIAGGNLYSSDLYGKNKKIVDELGYSANTPISYDENIIYKDGNSIKRYNINTKISSVIHNEGTINYKFYVKDDLVHIVNSNQTKTVNLLIEADLNYDGIIDINDISLIAIKYNSKKGNSGWNNNYDLNKDGIIDLFDLVTISKKIS